MIFSNDDPEYFFLTYAANFWNCKDDEFSKFMSNTAYLMNFVTGETFNQAVWDRDYASSNERMHNIVFFLV